VGCPASIRFGETTADIENSYAGVCAILAIGGKIEVMALIFIPPSTFAFHLRNFIVRNMPRAWLGVMSLVRSSRKLNWQNAVGQSQPLTRSLSVVLPWWNRIYAIKKLTFTVN
jgi:hypothetical protein